MVRLLEVIDEWAAQKRAAGHGQLHRGVEPALHDREVRDREMLVELVYVTAYLEARVRKAGRIRCGDLDGG